MGEPPCVFVATAVELKLAPCSLPQVYLLMLRHGLRTRNLREILGQLPRIVFGFLGSLVGRVPTGNTGGANVKAEQPMPIPADLQRLLCE